MKLPGLTLPTLLALSLGACSGGSNNATNASPPPPATTTRLQGVAMGGRQPITGSAVVIYGAGANSGAVPTQLGTGATDGSGHFDIPINPADGQIVYVVISGGNAGSGSANPVIRLMTVAGAYCDNSQPGCSFPDSVNVNELSTAAAVYALGPFIDTTTGNVNVSGSSPGLPNAAITFARLVNAVNGTVASFVDATTCTGSGEPTNCAALRKLDTLANLTAGCVNSSGAASAACSGVFSVTGASTDTLSALLAVARQAAVRNDGAGVFSVVSPPSIYTPALSAAPNDWALALNLSGGGLSQPAGLAIDSGGDVWVANNISPGTVTVFAPDGRLLSPVAGYTGGGLDGPIGVAIDQNDNVWIANWAQGSGKSVTELASDGTPVSGSSGYVGGGMDGPIAVAITASGAAWVANYSNASLTKLTALGTASGPLKGGGINFPTNLALDAGGNVWTANQGGDSVSELDTNGTPVSASGYAGGGLAQPTGIAIDESGNVHVANFGSSSLSILIGGNTPMSCGNPPTAGQTGCPLSQTGFTGGGLAGPNSVAIDGAGRSWVANFRGNVLSELDADGTTLSPSAGYGSGPLLQPYSVAVDASGNIWMTNFGSDSVTQFIGIAAPVKTPLIGVPVTP